VNIHRYFGAISLCAAAITAQADAQNSDAHQIQSAPSPSQEFDRLLSHPTRIALTPSQRLSYDTLTARYNAEVRAGRADGDEMKYMDRRVELYKKYRARLR
jgi:hypothetical protein